MKNKFYLLFFLLTFAVLGFTRDFLFVNINNHLYNLFYQRQTHSLPNSLLFLTSYTYKTIYFGKYFLTLFYFTGYFLVTYFSVKLICGNKKFNRFVFYIYGVLFFIAILFMAYNYIFNHKFDGDEYTVSRWVMGIAQSPLVAFFMIASYKLYLKFNADKII